MTPRYAHTQYAPLCLLLYAVALGSGAMAVLLRDTPGVYGTAGSGLVLVLLAAAFHHLTVEDAGAVLRIRFGPLPLFARTAPYADITRVEIGRTMLLDGWGIHLSLRGGWVWNLWGRACVVVHFRNGRILRIGTDDAVGLARFLTERTTSV